MTAKVQEIRLNLPHIELAAHLFGPEDGRPVIALHGWLDNAMSFARLAPKLEGVRILALDFAGHGHSGHRAPGASYLLWDYALDVLMVADQMGWERFSLLGHSMGAIVSVLLAGAMPERIERLALIDGLVPYTGEPDTSPQKLGEALRAQLALPNKRKPVYEAIDRAVEARMKGVGAVSREAAELLASRGLVPVPGGYTWRTDARLTLPSPLRLTRAHARQFVQSVQCPTSLVLAQQGLMLVEPATRELLKDRPFEVHELPGQHHLHLDDEAGAEAVAAIFRPFLLAD
ncbi:MULTISPECIES: alpha/beta fold hydrolase [Pseudomonas]|uniref:Alpha/beta hydrolase n=1 Tax=Pseudomonas multiresinivorans TaxID=95301 RepID=A0A7Z3BPI5_9PSED|nr:MULTISPECIES: alpha/beta hydrolase [Pseudomonas]MDG9856160.1 alpha/beta hydrolase [Pseudomonas nitroreducens]MDH1075746.1 alpha/beta hydrolase [Pseudomonas nitroreducens]NMZ74247.1 alpha/beta hydrolase [Pseudomonas nitroreducens]NNN28696.1 alpha/beta hydrolase [Pseudomonas nitroreducens]OBY58823.1 alpha/beta hydrolase [Pseudomonas sp. AU12215]